MIKEVARLGLPETNSSSSHSVVISMDSKTLVPKEEWELDIDENLILRVPRFNSFGRHYFKSNRIITKIQYLSCYFLSGTYLNLPTFRKKAHKFTQVIKDILGVKGVIFETIREWIDITSERFWQMEFPEVDHESLDIFSEILESEETIKNFLLNKNTWIYGGADGYREAKFYYLDTEIENKVIGCFSCYLGGFIGRVDIEIYDGEMVDSYETGQVLESITKMLSNFSYDFSTEKFIISQPFMPLVNYQKYSLKEDNRNLFIEIAESASELWKHDKGDTELREYNLKSEFKLYEYDVFEI